MSRPTEEQRLADRVERIRGLAGAADASVVRIEGGLSNSVYLVDAGRERFVVRIEGINGALLVRDRSTEEAALRRAVEAGFAPEIVEIDAVGGDLVTRFIPDATPLTVEQFTSDVNIRRVASRLRDVHRLEPIDGRFDPYDDIRRWLHVVDRRGLERPAKLAPLLEMVEATKRGRAPLAQRSRVLCHNDPFHMNFLDDGTLWLIDWEYAGMGDRMYDLASVGYVLDDEGRDVLLTAYFGEVSANLRADLEAMIRVVLCWNVVWSLVQIDGGVPGFDFLGFAAELLDEVPKR
jgi:thiamine kinase-like enzyme